MRALRGDRSNCVIVIGIVYVVETALQKLECRRQGFGNHFSSRGDDDNSKGPAPATCFRSTFVVTVLQHQGAILTGNMNILVLLSLLLFIPFIFFLVFLALSSCMGDGFRARISGMSINPRHGSYGRGYARGLGSGAGSAGWEQIEMEDMMGEDSSDDDLPRER
jgi:hypothetical protein